ncbi:MAG: hypothetical protein PVG66_05040 [Chromatiales bacterium]|jgi:hypothetical protein
MLRYLVIFLITPISLSHADIWESKNEWNEHWEDAYSQWVQEHYTADIFTSGKYQGFLHDCSDSVYYARLLFAYENQLPFVIEDPDYTGENSRRSQTFDEQTRDRPDNPYDVVTETISNDMDFYDHLEPKQRLARFVELVGRVTWTRSLLNDTYPVQLNRQWFRPGIVAVLPKTTVFSEGDFDILNYDVVANNLEATTTAGHAQLVTRVDETGVIHYLKSTIPAKVQPLLPTTLNSFVPDIDGGSYRRWKQPQHYAMEESELPGYGTEQFDLDGVFEDVMQQRLALVNESKTDKLARLANEVCAQLQQRIPVVQYGWEYKQQIGERCMNFDEYDLHSTPSRDGKIINTLKYLLYVATGDENSPADKIAVLLEQSCNDLMLDNETRLPAAKFARQLLSNSEPLSDPNQPLAVRWSLQPAQEIGCEQYY